MRPSPFSPVCSQCGQRAPIVLRGLSARCTACGAPRLPFGPRSLTLTGQPSRIGGAVASVAGWVVLVFGLSLATFLGLLLQSIWPASLVGWAFAVPIAALSLLFGLGLVLSGRKLRQHGTAAQRALQFDALRALVVHRGGSVTALEAAQALDLPEEQSDALLTELAKDPNENVSLEIDDDGRIHYLFGLLPKRWRVLEAEAAAREQAEAAAREDAARTELDEQETKAHSVKR